MECALGRPMDTRWNGWPSALRSAKSYGDGAVDATEVDANRDVTWNYHTHATYIADNNVL